MFKQTIISILILAIIASSAFAAPIFSFRKLFETVNKRSPADSNVCCLPNVFSVKGSFDQVAINNGNATLQSVTGGFNYTEDFKTGKIRQDVFYTMNGAASKYSIWYFKISSSLTVSYDFSNGKCYCNKLTNFINWNPLCITASGSITKAKIGAYDALKIESSQLGGTGTFWTFREPQMASDKCWILSTYEVTSSSSQEQIYYDMVEKVDGNTFGVPLQCPTMDKCLAQ